jgi:hypothetical protein
VFFPDNRNHRKAFVALWFEIKYADGQFLTSCTKVGHKYDLSERSVDIVRAKLKRLGLLKRISHFDPRHGYRSGWSFSTKFSGILGSLIQIVEAHRESTDRPQDRLRDQHSLLFV